MSTAHVHDQNLCFLHVCAAAQQAVHATRALFETGLTSRLVLINQLYTYSCCSSSYNSGALPNWAVDDVHKLTELLWLVYCSWLHCNGVCWLEYTWTDQQTTRWYFAVCRALCLLVGSLAFSSAIQSGVKQHGLFIRIELCCLKQYRHAIDIVSLVLAEPAFNSIAMDFFLSW
jgi:hypothetical protein